MDLSIIPVPILFVITLACAIANGNCKAWYVKKIMRNESEQYSFNSWNSIICVIFLLIFSLGKLTATWYTVMLGAVFGVVTMIFAILQAKAVKIGPFGYTTVIVNLSTALTALSGAIFWRENLSAFKIAGIVLMIGSFVLAIDTGNNGGKKANIKWFILCLFALLSSALIGILQKIHQTSGHSGELTVFLIVAFLTSAIISYGGYILQKKKENAIIKEVNEEKPSEKKKILIIILLLCGIGAAGNNVINLYLSGVTDTAIFFPIVNGVPLLSSLVVSFLVFKERLKIKQIVGLCLGIIALLCLFI